MLSLVLVPLALLPSALAADPLPLRILPAGASVTFGVGSSTGNSYRKDLRDLLVSAGHPVKFVGRRRSGAFPDNENEATSGFVLSQIASAATAAAPLFLPNVVLLEAGTNNCNSGDPVPDAGANLTALVRELFRLVPGTTIVATTLLANTVAAQDACRVAVNARYVEAARVLVGEGARFVLVDMRGTGAPTTADLADTRHPNDRGYALMAGVWKKGIDAALASEFVTPPADNGIPLDGDVATQSVSSMVVGEVMESSAAPWMIPCARMLALGLGIGVSIWGLV